jgi:predicted ribosomally synthesized peptide with SipW-like signal peptide
MSAVGSVVGSGTMATFNAKTSNPSNTFATGTLVLSDTTESNGVGATQVGTACLSANGGGGIVTNANTSCGTAFSVSLKLPGDSVTANLQIRNDGSDFASTFTTFSNLCTDANASLQVYNGAGNICQKAEVYIQQTDSTYSLTPAHEVACLYGGGSSTQCSFSASKTLANLVSSTCQVVQFGTYCSPAAGNELSISASQVSAGPCTANPGASPPVYCPGLDGNGNAYFVIGVMLPSNADNTLQGRSASIDFDWYIQQ